MAKAKKSLDSEVNLIAFISLLSVLICSLLLSAVWVQIGSMNVKQAIGGQSQDETSPRPALWARFDPKGRLLLKVQDSVKVPKKMRQLAIVHEAGRINFAALEKHVASLKGFEPALNMALIQPESETVYEDIIALMDHFKQWGLHDLGVAPL